MGKLPIILCLLVGTLSYEILYSFNCGSQTTIHSPLVVFKSDEMYEGLKSHSHKKESLPTKYKDPSDIQLLTYERVTDQNAFSYFLKLTGADHYFLLLKFIEVVHEKPAQRVFEVKLGDEVVSEIDIAKEAGKGEILNKWIEFQLRDDVLYINKTTPVLNGYIYPKQTMKLTFAKIAGKPKIQALILLKGVNSTQFISEYMQNEKKRVNKREELTCQKYQREHVFQYRHMTGRQKFNLPRSQLQHFIHQLLSLGSLFSVVAVLLVIFSEKIYQRFNILKEDVKEQ